jgi:hypothetical protein
MDTLLDSRQLEARRLYLAYTGDRCRIDSLYGPAKASCRAHILSALRGVKVTQSKAGWSMFREAIYELFGATGDCSAAREDSLAELARACKPVMAQVATIR